MPQCRRHPDRVALHAVVTHFLDEDWRHIIKADQVLAAICEDCRLELIHWILPDT